MHSHHSDNFSLITRWERDTERIIDTTVVSNIFSYEIECRLFLEEEPDDLFSPLIIEVGLCELAEVSELLFSPCPFPTTHNLSNILLDREGNNCTALPLLLLPFLINFTFFKWSSSLIFIWDICSRRDLLFTGTFFTQSSSLFESSPFLELFFTACTPAAVLTCSKKRTCTTTRSGSRSFCAACLDASIISFFTSISPHNFFFSAFVKFGCSCSHNNLLVLLYNNHFTL